MTKAEAQYQLSQLKHLQMLVQLKMITHEWYATIMTEILKTLRLKEPIPLIPEKPDRKIQYSALLIFAKEQSQIPAWHTLYPKNITTEELRLKHWGAHPAQRKQSELEYFGYSTFKTQAVCSSRRGDFFLYLKDQEEKTKLIWAHLIKKYRKDLLALTQCSPLIMDLHQVNSSINMANEVLSVIERIPTVGMDEAYTLLDDAPKRCARVQNIFYSFERDLLFKALASGLFTSEAATQIIGNRQELWHKTMSDVFHMSFVVSKDFLSRQQAYLTRCSSFEPAFKAPLRLSSKRPFKHFF